MPDLQTLLETTLRDELGAPLLIERHGDRWDTLISFVGPEGQVWVEFQTWNDPPRITIRVADRSTFDSWMKVFYCLAEEPGGPITSEQILARLELALDIGPRYRPDTLSRLMA